MKKVFWALLVITAVAGCSNYGKKLKIEGTKGEVYYKGDGVSEADAKKTGEFLKTQGFFNNEKGASVQISKEGDAYTMRFVYDKDVYDTLKNVDDLFKVLAAQASKDVFDGKKVNIALANKMFKDYKSISFDENVAKQLDAPQPEPGNDGLQNKSDFKHDSEAGVDFYWYGIPDSDAKIFHDYIVSNGSFNGGTAELYMTQEDGRYIVRFPMLESGRQNPETMAKVEEVSKQIKDNVFANNPYSFYVTDERLVTVKAYDY